MNNVFRTDLPLPLSVNNLQQDALNFDAQFRVLYNYHSKKCLTLSHDNIKVRQHASQVPWRRNTKLVYHVNFFAFLKLPDSGVVLKEPD